VGTALPTAWREAAVAFDCEHAQRAEMCFEPYVSVDGAPGPTSLVVLCAGTAWVLSPSR